MTFEGGWKSVAEALEVPQKHQTDLKRMVKAGAHVEWKVRGLSEHVGLWLYNEKRGSRAGPGYVRIIVNDLLAPGLAPSMTGSSRTKRLARRLVPELRFDPPVGGIRNNEHGAVWVLSRLFLVHLVTEAEELYRHEGVRIDEETWRRLASEAGLPYQTLDRVLSSWEQGESDAAPALILRDGERYTLASPHDPEREFIMEGGRRSIEGKKAGQKGAKRRAQKRRK